MRNTATLLLLILPFFAFATDYYVSPNGNNSNAGTINSPWETVQYGIDQLTAGDALYLRAGTYGEKVNVNVSGTSNSRITITNYQNELAILDGTGLNFQIAMIDIVNQDFITIQGLTIRNNMMIDAQGIHVAGVCEGIEILSNIIYEINFSTNPNLPANSNRNAQSIIVYGTSGSDPITNLKINGNEIYDCMLGYSEALAVNGNVDGFEVISNYVHNNTNIGIDIIGHEGTAPANDQARNGLIKYNVVHDCVSEYATSGGLYVDGGKDLIFENNESYRNGYGIEIGCENVNETTSNVIVRNNIIYDNVEAGLSLGGYNYPFTGAVVDSKVTGNTFYKNDNSNSYSGEMYLSYSENCEITSNIFYTSDLNTFAYVENAQPGLVIDYNNIFNPAGSTEFEVDWNGSFYYGYTNYLNGTGNDSNSTHADPLFVNGNITNPDFHITAASPAINVGNPNYIVEPGEEDVNGNNRVHNAIIDCGVHEFGSTPISSHCTDGIQNEDETGIDCGGADCVACPSCTDGIQNGAETGIDCGGPDCPACPTCSDGIQNGNETGIDCGGPDCGLCGTTGCDVVIAEDFEAGWGVWNDGGSDCLRTAADAPHANSGTYCIRLRDNTSSSVVTTDNLDMSSYPDATVSCSFKTLGFNPGHKARLEYSTNGGTSWNVAKEWTYSTDFTNNSRVDDAVDISASFTSNTKFRFVCDAATNGDRLYLDDVVINGCNGTGGGATCTDGIQNGNETGIDCGGSECNPCATCSDGIMNGNETDIDCGGPDCDPCGSGGPCGEIDAESFENGWGMWVDGGSDCLRAAADAIHANTGSFCIRLRDNTSSSTLTSASMDLSGFESIEVELSFKTLGFNAASQFVWLEMSDDGGTTWYDVNEWNYNDEFVNNVRYDELINVFGPFTTDSKIRLRCDAANNGDRFFVDDIVISGCTANGNFNSLVDDVIDVSEIATGLYPIGKIDTEMTVDFYPNPASSRLNVEISNPSSDNVISIYSIGGKMISQQYDSSSFIELNLDHLEGGMYFLSVKNQEEQIVEKFIKL